MNGTVRLVASVPEAFADLVADELATAAPGGYALFLSGGGTAVECYRAAGRPGRAPAGAASTSTSATSGASRPTTPTPTTG